MMTAMNNDDAQLLTEVRRGDATAWETLIRRYVDVCWRLRKSD